MIRLDAQNFDPRFALAAPAGDPPPPPPRVGRGGGCCDCWTPIARCIVTVAQAVWHAVRDLFRAIYHYFAGNRAVNNDRLDGEDPNAGLQREIDTYCNTWRRESHGETLSRKHLAAYSQEGILKYVAFVTLRRFEYSNYPGNYREHYFDEITRRAKLLTMELLKLEADRAAANPGDQATITRRIAECLREVGHAAATGCDPRKASVTLQQWKAVSGRVEISEILLQHIQDAKLAIFKRYVTNGHDGDMDTNAWAVHAYNWIYANFGARFGLCSRVRADDGRRDGFSNSGSVQGMVARLQDLQSTGQMEHTFRQEFTQEYLEGALLDAINRDEHQVPYIECLQNFCPEVQEDPNKFDDYVTTSLQRQGMVSYIFKPKAVQFFLSLKDGPRDLSIDWGNDQIFWSFISDRMPTSTEDTIPRQELEQISLVHLLRLYRRFVR